MPNDITQRANRRRFLIGAGTAAVAIPVPVGLALQANVPAVLASAPTMAPRERLDLAVAELQTAAAAVFPDLDKWMINIEPKSILKVMILARGSTKPGRAA